LAKPAQSRVKLALLGADTLLGREIAERLKSSAPVSVTEFSPSGDGAFGEQEGEAVFLHPLDAAALDEHQFIALAGTSQGAEKVYGLAKDAQRKPVVIDCTGELEGKPEARIATAPGDSWLRVPPHPAAQAIASVLARMNQLATVRQSLAHVFEPASERGQKGIDELHSQTRNLLSFKQLDKQVYDAQVAFNLLARFGEDAPLKLSAIEHRIERHLATLLSREGGRITAMPSLRVVQVPVFHGYSISLWTEFERNMSADEIIGALGTADIDVRDDEQDAPDNVGVAGQSGLTVGDVRIDRNNGRAAWIWIAADNLRLLADAVAILVGA
jgi:aspartate-semialdehyde dehydrogenase